MDKSYYIYEHREADTGRTFYVGKGNRKRAWRLDSRNAHWKSIVALHGFTVAIIHEGLSVDRASDLEVSLIAAYGLENLANKTEGGGGSAGFTHSEETKARMSAAKKGKTGYKHSAEARAKMSAACTGRKMSQEAVAKMKASKKGWRMSPDQREKAVAVLQANRPTSFGPDARANMAASAKERGAVISLSHPAHGVVTGKCFTFRETYGLSTANISKLRSGKALSAKGWTLAT